jgi:hypothetical protein
MSEYRVRYKELIPENTILNNVEELPPPTYYEVSQVIQNFKKHKAARSDNIPAELKKMVG